MLLANLFDNPWSFFAFIFALLIVLTMHEVSHGLVALWLGDSTAKDMGRLSFNPLHHLDPIGTLMMFLIGFGWGKPVPVNYSNLSNQKWGPALVSIAGPVSNFIMVLCFGLIYKLLVPGQNPLYYPGDNLAHVFLSYLIIYSAMLGAFNLIPLAPLDGSKILFAVMPDKYENLKYWLSSKGPMILIGLLILDSVMESTVGFSFFSGFFNGILNVVSKFF